MNTIWLCVATLCLGVAAGWFLRSIVRALGSKQGLGPVASDASPLSAVSYRRPPKAKKLRDVDDTKIVDLLVTLRPQKPLTEGDDVALSRSELVARWRTDPAVLDRLFTFTRSHGLTARQTDATGNLVMLSGTYAQARSAFRPEHLAIYDNGKRQFVGRSGHLSIPSDLARDIVSISGFDRRAAPTSPNTRPLPAAMAAGGAALPKPADVARSYGFPANLTGSGQTIGIIALGGGFDKAQMSQYFSDNGIPRTGTLDWVSVDKTPNDPNTQADPDYTKRVCEVQMDIEIVGSVAPAANIVVYFGSYGDLSGLQAALHCAVIDTVRAPSVIIVSWQFAENHADDPSGSFGSICQSLKMAKTANITVCVASGDFGAYEDETDPSTPVVSFPASHPLVLACGGTMQQPGQPEEAWSNSGGGYSAVFDRPGYQSGGASTKRGVPDVAAFASPGYIASVNGGAASTDGADMPLQGTSLAAPLWGGLVALINQKVGKPVGFINDKLYASPGSFTDIVTGGNAQFPATQGWDAVSGLGVPKGADILKLF